MIIPMTICMYSTLPAHFHMYPLIMSILWMISLAMNNPTTTVFSPITFIDSTSALLILLSILSTFLIFMSLKTMKSKTLLMMIMIILIITFSSSNPITFYIMFESVLIPTLILITKMGNQPERLQAGMYLMIYTITASLPLLLSILILSPNLTMIFPPFNYSIPISPLIFIMAFLAKMPMFLLHLWLPKAHVEAPLEGSMILAAVLLKLGGYGLIRFIPIICSNLKSTPYWIISISTIGALNSSMNCMRQKDLKALIAYSSVAHMGVVLSSLFTMNVSSTNGAMIMMIAHGLSSSALFFLVNIIYTKFHTRNIMSFKGLMTLHPNITFWWFMFTAVNISAPPTINLISEIMMMMGLISWNMHMMLPLSMIIMTTSTFSVMLFIMIIHNKNNLMPSENTPPKFFLSLFLHFIFSITLVMKLETMLLI